MLADLCRPQGLKRFGQYVIAQPRTTLRKGPILITRRRDTFVARADRDGSHKEWIMELIGAGVTLAGILLFAAMWLSKRGGDVRSDRDPGYTRDRTDRYDAPPQRVI